MVSKQINERGRRKGGGIASRALRLTTERDDLSMRTREKESRDFALGKGGGEKKRLFLSLTRRARAGLEEGQK